MITKALHRGAISDVVSATTSGPKAKHPSHDESGEALKASKATTDTYIRNISSSRSQ